MEFLNNENPRVLISTSRGDITVELFPKNAPITVENFLKLVGKDFYNGLIFHRVINGFMIQGGDPTGTGMGGSEDTIKGEFTSNNVENLTPHLRGTISMARSMMPNSASSQFFICHKDVSQLDSDYAAFGYVTEGLDTVDFIASVETDSNDKPIDRVLINTIKKI